jgi:DNA-directed RNA polymerase specialized sigma24 family protein
MIPRSRWQQIQSLFEELVDTSEGERAARLATACGEDLDLRTSVESLLQSDQRREDPLLQAIGEAAESLLEDHQDRLIGTRIGPYRVVSILGHGGMTYDQIAVAVGTSAATVHRDIRLARAWLLNEIGGARPP